MNQTPISDEVFSLLHAAGWSLGETQVLSQLGFYWLVDASKDGHLIQARAKGQAVA